MTRLFAATFQFLFRKFVVDPSSVEGCEVSPSVARMLFPGIALNALLATPVMMAQMAVLQLVSGDTQVQDCDYFAQILTVVAYRIISIRPILRNKSIHFNLQDRLKKGP